MKVRFRANSCNTKNILARPNLSAMKEYRDKNDVYTNRRDEFNEINDVRNRKREMRNDLMKMRRDGTLSFSFCGNFKFV